MKILQKKSNFLFEIFRIKNSRLSSSEIYSSKNSLKTGNHSCVFDQTMKEVPINNAELNFAARRQINFWMFFPLHNILLRTSNARLRKVFQFYTHICLIMIVTSFLSFIKKNIPLVIFLTAVICCSLGYLLAPLINTIYKRQMNNLCFLSGKYVMLFLLFLIYLMFLTAGVYLSHLEGGELLGLIASNVGIDFALDFGVALLYKMAPRIYGFIRYRMMID